MADVETARTGPSPWLEDYLADAIARRLCVRVHCTTCGAMEFRRGLYARATRAVGVPVEHQNDERLLSELIRQLALLAPDWEKAHQWFDAVHFIFCEVWFSVGAPTAERVYQPMLEGTWAGSVLRDMQEHYRRRMEAARLHKIANDPDLVRARREETRRLKQQQHAARLARKKERDRSWFEKHPRDAPSAAPDRIIEDNQEDGPLEK